MIRDAHIDDLPGLVKLVMGYRDFHGVKNQSADEVKQFLISRMENNQSKIFVATNDSDKIIGYIQLYPSYSTLSLKPQWVLNDFFIDADYRKKGYGRALMAYVKDYFRDKAKGFILVTNKSNLNAKSFYKNNGWNTGEYDFYTFYY